MYKYEDIDKFFGYTNLDSLTKEAQDIPGIGSGSASALDMFTGGGTANPMGALMGGLVPGMGGGGAGGLMGGLIGDMVTGSAKDMLLDYAIYKGVTKAGPMAYNWLTKNPAQAKELATELVQTATNPAAANVPGVSKFTQYLTTKGITPSQLLQKIPGLKTVTEKGLGTAAKEFGGKALAKTLGTKAAPTLLGRGLGMATGPLGWAFLGVQGINWLLGNDSKQWMSKAVDLLFEKNKDLKPEDKSNFLNTLMESFTKGVESLMAEEAAQQQTAALIINREKQAFIYNNKFNSREASFTLFRLKEEEQNLIEQIELYKEANVLTSILGIDNIITQIEDLIKSPEVLELVTRAVKESKLPEEKHQALIKIMMDTIEKGLETLKSELEEQKKQQNTNAPTDKANAPENNAAQNTDNPIAPNTDTTTQPLVDNSVVDINGVAYNPTNKQGPNGMVVTDAQGKEYNYNPQTRVVTPA